MAKNTFISLDEEWFRKYVMDALGFAHECYGRCALVDEHFSLLVAPTQSYEGYREVE